MSYIIVNNLKLVVNINLNERCGSLNKFEFLQEEQNLELQDSPMLTRFLQLGHSFVKYPFEKSLQWIMASTLSFIAGLINPKGL